MDLSKAHIMDGQHVLSQEHMRIAEDIAHTYDNLRLIWIPPVDRIPGTDDRPFAIKDINTENIIVRIPETAIHLAMDWLYDNDSQRTNTLQAFEDANAKAAADRTKEAMERNAPRIDLATSILKSNLHTFKHDGITYSDSGIEIK